MSAIISEHIAIEVGDLFTENFISEIKHALQAKYGVVVVKSTNETAVTLQCQHSGINHCGFHCSFSIEQRLIMNIYKLRTFNLIHNINCYDQETANFLYNKHLINNQSGAIAQIVYQMLRRKQRVGSPKKIVEILCKQVGLPSDFFKKNIETHDHRRRLKKRLDNIISETKRNIPWDIRNMYTFEELQQLLSDRPLTKSQIKRKKANQQKKIKIPKQQKKEQEQNDENFEVNRKRSSRTRPINKNNANRHN